MKSRRVGKPVAGLRDSYARLYPDEPGYWEHDQRDYQNFDESEDAIDRAIVEMGPFGRLF